MIQQISVFVENETGSIARVTSILKSNKIDIRAIAGFDGPSYSILRLIVDNPTKAVDILKNACYSVKMSAVLAVELIDSIGSLDNMLQLLKENDIELNYIYSFVLDQKGGPWMIINVSEMEKAEELLRNNKFTCMP